MEKLLTEMSSTFNEKSAEEPQINLNEDNTLKWRGLHNNSYASNKRRTRKTAKIDEANSSEDRAEEEKNGAAAESNITPPPTLSDPEGASKAVVKPVRVLRRTRTSLEVVSPPVSSAAEAQSASKRAAVLLHANGGVAAAQSKQQQSNNTAHKQPPINVVVISTKSNKDKDQHTTTTTATAPSGKDNEEELVVLQKLSDEATTTKTIEQNQKQQLGKATAIGTETNPTDPEPLNGTGGDGRQSKRVTRRRTSTAPNNNTVQAKQEMVQLKRKVEDDQSPEKKPEKDQASSEDNPNSTTTTSEEKKPRLLMKIRTDSKSVSIIQNSQSVDAGEEGKMQGDPLPAEGEEKQLSSAVAGLTATVAAPPPPPPPPTEPKKRGRKPGSSLKNKFPEKVKILPKRTGVRGQQSPEQSSLAVQQRPSRRIKPTPKILENEELRVGFEQQNSARLLGLNASEYDAKKAALGKSGQVEQLNVDNIYSTSNKPCPEPEDFLNELKNSKLNSNGNSPPTEEDEKLDRKQQKLKERHLHQLGLRKTSRSDTGSELSQDGQENGPFRPPPKVSIGRHHKQQQQTKSKANHSLDSDDLQVRRKVTTNAVAREKFNCLCTQMSEFYSHKTAKSLFCSAVDQIRAEKVGCCNDISGNPLNLQRPSARVSFMVLCQSHKNRFHSHHCCPVCGVFCTEGQFMLCSRNHLFHRECVVRSLGGGGVRRHHELIKCPHCGVDVAEPEVNLYMECSNELTYYPNQEGFIKTARISLSNGLVAIPQRVSTNGQIGFDIDTLIPESVQNVRDRYRQRRGGGGGSNRGGSETEFTSHEFFFAVNNDDIEKVAEIIASGFDVAAPFKEFHWGTCLHLIAHFGSLNMMYLILSRVASVDFINAQDKELRTAAMCAVVGQKHEILRLLIQCGADVARRGPDGMTVLHLAAKVGNLTATEIILEHYRLKVTFQKFKSFINDVDDGRWTALVWAAENGLSAIESYLISLGASPNICDSENNSALHWAALSNSVETILPLLGSDCNFNLQNVNGDTPLHIACRHGNAHMCLIFIAHGADLQIKNLADEMPIECVPDPNGTCAKLLKYNISLKSIAGGKTARIVLNNDLSMGREAYPVKLIGTGEVGETSRLPAFKYVTQAIIIQNSIQIDRRISQMRICACPDNCTTDACQCSEISSQNWYDGNGRLSNEFNFDDPPMIFECNDVCGCHKLLCKNRVVQHGSKVALQVEQSVKKCKGWSARSIAEIPKGTFVSEYTGEILTNAEADQRMDDSYFFDLGGSEHCIDANMYGNVSRFFNHSCSPNVVPIRVYYEHQDLRFPKIAFFASENIGANQEITFDYGDKFWMVKHKYFKCQCEAENCRYSVKTIDKTMEEINQRSQPITIIT